MKKSVLITILIIVFKISMGQMVVSDPANLAQSIMNTARTVGQSEATRGAVLENVLHTQRIFEQTKKYYEYLKKVNSVLKDAYEVKHTAELAKEITDLYSSSFSKISQDPLYTAEEIASISFGYTKIMEKCAFALSDLKNVVGSSVMSMTDKERMDAIDKCHEKMEHYRRLIEYYTKKVYAVSMIREQSRFDTEIINTLYE